MQEIAEAIWEITGKNPGPTTVLLGGIHGNEKTGITVVKQLKEKCEKREITIEKGKLILALGNPRAIEKNTRGSEPHADINRVFIDALLEGDRTDYEIERARILAPLLKSADLVIDLHATNKPSEPFLVIATDDQAQQALCTYFTCEKELVVPNDVIAGTTIGYANAHGAQSVCYESGWVEDLSRIPEMMRSVLYMIKEKNGVHEETHEQQTRDRTTRKRYRLTETILLTQEGFTFAPARGEGSFEAFKAGDVLGTHGTVPLIATHDGVIMFPKIPEHWKEGSPVCFLAQVL
jgi:succinylglutamate desuccinylase